MGYLDGDTITVDAVLTKKGRQMISEGRKLDIKNFTLSDTGIDYTLWDSGHASGSAYYGEAIEKLPMVEANVHSQYALRNKLITLNKDTISMPVLELSQNPMETWLFDTPGTKPITATIVGFSGGHGGCTALVYDTNVITLGGTKIDVSGNAMQFITEAGIASAGVYEVAGGGPSYSFKANPQAIRDTKNASTMITFIHTATGAYATIKVQVNFNKDTRKLINTSATTGG